jgi:hypothetical protein
MAKDKISDYSSTANSNTDIAGINIDEGCAPSGINDAIRTLMAQLKNFQTGTGGDSFNGPVGSTTASTGAFTTLSATGVASFAAGSASAPAITRTGDTNTGIFFPAADTIAFAEGGIETMRLDSSGNLGLGVSPGVKLDIGSGTLRIKNATGDSNGLQIYQDTSDTARIYNFYSGPLVFGTNNTERIRIPANAGGITFPATQSASSNANTLDDYEEGTWTPTFGAESNISSVSNASAYYVKIGKQVTLTGKINFTVTSANTYSYFYFTLPFAAETANASAGTIVENAVGKLGGITTYGAATTYAYVLFSSNAGLPSGATSGYYSYTYLTTT